MKKGVFIINTSRGALIDSAALLSALNNEKVRGAGLDVYEEEADIFFEDKSGQIIRDETLSLLVSRPNVIITSHQAFLTEEALSNIARVTFTNLNEFFSGGPLDNEICYHCDTGKVAGGCRTTRAERCFSRTPDAVLSETGTPENPGRQNLPGAEDGDGFFYAKLIKK